MAWDPSSGLTFGEYMRGGSPRGGGVRTAEVRASREERDADTLARGHRDDGTPFTRLVDRDGHVTTKHRDGRRDVRINLR